MQTRVAGECLDDIREVKDGTVSSREIRGAPDGKEVLDDRDGKLQRLSSLPSMRLICAEGVPAESYLATGNRSALARCGAAVSQFRPASR